MSSAGGWTPAPSHDAASQTQEHGAKPDEAGRRAVKLPHLAEYICLLDPLDDPAVVDPYEIEKLASYMRLVAGAPYSRPRVGHG